MKMKLRNALAVGLLFLFCMAGAHTVKAQTIIGGSLTSNTVLTTAASPYSLNADLVVTAGVTLTIDPGVVVDFPAAARDLIVESGGTLICEGTSSQRINLFSSNGFGGGSVYVKSGGSASIDYTDLDTLGATTLSLHDCAIRVDDDATFSMDNTVFSNTQAAIRGDANAFTNIGSNNSLNAKVVVFNFSLDGSATWPKIDPTGVSYQPDGDIEILSGDVLTIEPGVEISFTATG